MNAFDAKPRKWWAAFLFGLLLPGLGQVYNSQLKKGVTFFVLLVLLAALLALLVALQWLNPVVLMVTMFSLRLYILFEAPFAAKNLGEDFILKPYNRWHVYLSLILAGSFLFEAGEYLVEKRVVQAHSIPSEAMEDTLVPGDYIFARKFNFTTPAGQFQVGDILVFQSPEDPQLNLVKRCVATAGQTVQIRDKELYVDGQPFAEPPGVKFADPHTLPAAQSDRDNFGPHTVPPDHLFFLGDNRDNSRDSRFYGSVPKALVRGKAVSIYSSWDEQLSQVRWERIGQKID